MGPRVLLLGVEQPVGRVATRLLQAAGVRVTVAVHDAESGAIAKRMGVASARTVGLDGFREAFRTHDTVCNMLPVVMPPAGPLMRASRGMARSGTPATAQLVPAAWAGGVSRWVQRSTVSVYPDLGHTWIPPTTDSAPHPRLRGALAAEAATVGTASLQGVVLRLGHLWGHDDPATLSWLAMARQGWQPLGLPQDSYWPTLHLEDAADAVLASLKVPPGTYNVADLNVLTISEVDSVLTRVSSRPYLRALGPNLSSSDTRFYGRSHRVESGSFSKVTGWHPTTGPFATALPRLAEILATSSPRPRSGWRTELPW